MVKLIDSSVVVCAMRLHFGDKISDILPLIARYSEGTEHLEQELTLFFADGAPSVKVGIHLDKSGLVYTVVGETFYRVAEKYGFSGIYLNYVSLCNAIEKYLKNYLDVMTDKK